MSEATSDIKELLCFIHFTPTGFIEATNTEEHSHDALSVLLSVGTH